MAKWVSWWSSFHDLEWKLIWRHLPKSYFFKSTNLTKHHIPLQFVKSIKVYSSFVHDFLLFFLVVNTWHFPKFSVLWTQSYGSDSVSWLLKSSGSYLVSFLFLCWLSQGRHSDITSAFMTEVLNSHSSRPIPDDLL